jgi:uncharacterized protein DUF6084
MPELSFQIVGVETVQRALAPLLHFKLRVTAPAAETIQALIIQAQIQIQAPQRSYSMGEKEKLVDMFGTPERWGQTLDKYEHHHRRFQRKRRDHPAGPVQFRSQRARDKIL